jgi:hypothetical protein
MKANPGKVKNMVGHSKGSAVIDQYMRVHKEFKGKARIYSTPNDDLTGRETIKDFLDTSRQERGEYFKDKNIFARAANAVQDQEQDLLEWATGFDTVKGSKAKGIKHGRFRSNLKQLGRPLHTRQPLRPLDGRLSS